MPYESDVKYKRWTKDVVQNFDHGIKGIQMTNSIIRSMSGIEHVLITKSYLFDR